MNDDYDALRRWAVKIQGLKPGLQLHDNVLRTVIQLEETARTAESLPFETEPAGFVRLFESLARGDGDDV